MADSDGQETEETPKGPPPKDLNHARRYLDSYQSDVEDIRQRLQAALDEDDPTPITMIVLQQYLADLDTMDRRGSRDVQTLIRRETDEDLMETDKVERKLLRAGMAQTKNLGMNLLYLKTANNLILEVDRALGNVERKQAMNPTKDYSPTLATIANKMKELEDSLRGSDIPHSHMLWAKPTN